LLSGFGSINGRMSFLLPQRAEPYSISLRHFLAFLLLCHTIAYIMAAPISPTRRSFRFSDGIGRESEIFRFDMPSINFRKTSFSFDSLYDSPHLLKNQNMSAYGKVAIVNFLAFAVSIKAQALPCSDS